MKTIEATDGKILRMPDHKAARFVSAGTGKYVPKSRWKKIVDEEIAALKKQGVVGVIINKGTSFMPNGAVETVHRESKSDRIKRQRKERQKV